MAAKKEFTTAIRVSSSKKPNFRVHKIFLTRFNNTNTHSTGAFDTVMLKTNRRGDRSAGNFCCTANGAIWSILDALNWLEKRSSALRPLVLWNFGDKTHCNSGVFFLEDEKECAV